MLVRVLCFADSGSLSGRAWGMVSVGPDDNNPAAPPKALVSTGALTRLPGHPRSLASQAEPSWGRVLADTVKLAVLRRRPAAGPRQRPASGSGRWPVGRLWRAAALVLALAGAAMVVLWLTGALAGAPSRALRAPAAGTGPASPMARVRSRAAAWIAGQVSDGAIIACEPGLCPVLQDQGIGPGRLRSTRSPLRLRAPNFPLSA